MSKFYQYMNAVAISEEQYMIDQSEAMTKIMNGAKQIQLELFKDKDDQQVKLAVRTDGKIRIVTGDLAVNSIRAIEKLSGRANIMEDFLNIDTEAAMMNPSRDHSIHGGFDITITTQSDGRYRMLFTAPDARKNDVEADPKKPSRYISRNDLKANQQQSAAVSA